MASRTISPGAPNVTSQYFRWNFSPGDYILIGNAGDSSLFSASELNHYFGRLTLSSSSFTNSDFRMARSQTEGLTTTGPEFNYGFEGFYNSAFTLNVAGHSLSLSGPRFAGNDLGDHSEPYSWRYSAGERALIANFITQLNGLTAQELAGISITFDDGITEYLGGNRLFFVGRASSDDDILMPIDEGNPAGSIPQTLPPGLLHAETAVDLLINNSNRLYIIGRDETLWLVNARDPDDISGDFGLVGPLPSGVNNNTISAADHDNKLHLIDGSPDLWIIDVDDPSNEDNPYGEIGRIDTGSTNPKAAFSFNNDLYIAYGSGAVYRLDLDNINNNSIPSTLIGSFDTNIGSAGVHNGYIYLLGGSSIPELYRSDLSNIINNVIETELFGGFPQTEVFGYNVFSEELLSHNPNPAIEVSVDFDSGLSGDLISVLADIYDRDVIFNQASFDSDLSGEIDNAIASSVAPNPIETTVRFSSRLIGNIQNARYEIIKPALYDRSSVVTGGLGGGIANARSEFLDALESLEIDPGENLVLHALLKVDIPNDNSIYLSTLDININYNNNIYIGCKVLNISAVGGSSISQVKKIDVSLSGILPSDRDIFRTYVGVPEVTLQVIAINENGNNWMAVGNPLKGFLSSPKLQGGTYSFSISLKNIQANNNRTRTWSHEDRIRRFGKEDQGMSQMVLFEKKEVLGTWPQI